jgi:hypothetical protein
LIAILLVSPMRSPHDQQPIRRTVDRRQARDGRALSPADRAAMTRMAQYRTRAPKGVFVYYSAEEMNAARDRWVVDAMVAKSR